MARKSDQDQFVMRPMAVEDLDIISIWFEHLEEFSLFDRGAAAPANKENTKADWEKAVSDKGAKSGYWFAVDDSSGEICGIAGLDNINHINGDGVLAVYMSEPVRRKGLAIMASCYLLDIAFEQLRLHRITSYYRDDNSTTAKLTTLLGFTQEGVVREGWFSGGKHFNTYAVGVLANEWPSAREKLIAELVPTAKLLFGRTPWAAKSWPEKLV